MTQVNTSQSEPCKAHHEAGHAVIADGSVIGFISSPSLRMVRPTHKAGPNMLTLLRGT